MIKSAFVSLPPLAAIGIGLLLFYLGIRGLGIGLKGLANPDLLKPIDSPLVMFFVSTAVTLVWQSSSLTTALLVPMVASGHIGLLTSLTGVLGGNVGTTLTPHLAALFGAEGYHGDGLRLAVYHTSVNLLLAAVGLSTLWIATRLLRMLG